MHKQGIAFLAGLAPELQRKPGFGCHSNAAGLANVFCCEFRVCSGYFFGLPKQYIDPLACNLLNAALLHHGLDNAERRGSLT
jgi:hypothetical protein